MSLVSYARSLSELVQRNVRRLAFRRSRVKPLTFRQLARTRGADAAHGARSLCTCPQCRHARQTDAQPPAAPAQSPPEYD